MFYQLTFVQPQPTGWPMSTRGDLFAGLTVALVTPFKNGEIDFEDLGRLVDWHVEQGTDTLAPALTFCPRPLPGSRSIRSWWRSKKRPVRSTRRRRSPSCATSRSSPATTV